MPYLQVLGRPPVLAQEVPPATGKNGVEKTRDIAVVVATLVGASAALYNISPKNNTFQNITLGTSAAALAAIGLVTFINDVL